MKQAQTGEHERAAANATLLAVMRRMASPLRHDLAGALLIPSLRLQMLRRQLGAATLARERLQAMVDEVIAALDAVRKTQVEACGWLEQSDDTPVALDGALAAVMATFNLFFSARGIGLELRDSGAPQSLSYPAQALRLLLHAGFFLALDHAPRASTLVVECTANAGGARLSWHFEADKAAEGGPHADGPHADIETARDRLTPSGVAALCRIFGARFESDSAHATALGTLALPAALGIPALSESSDAGLGAG